MVQPDRPQVAVYFVVQQERWQYNVWYSRTSGSKMCCTAGQVAVKCVVQPDRTKVAVLCVVEADRPQVAV